MLKAMLDVLMFWNYNRLNKAHLQQCSSKLVCALCTHNINNNNNFQIWTQSWNEQMHKAINLLFWYFSICLQRINAVAFKGLFFYFHVWTGGRS